MLPPNARASLQALVEATKIPKERASLGEHGEIALGRHAVSITHHDSHVVRLASGTLDGHEGHGPRIRAYFDSILR